MIEVIITVTRFQFMICDIKKLFSDLHPLPHVVSSLNNNLGCFYTTVTTAMFLGQTWVEAYRLLI